MIWLHRVKHSVNIGLVTPEFKRVKYVHSLVDQQIGYVRFTARPCGDQC